MKHPGGALNGPAVLAGEGCKDSVLPPQEALQPGALGSKGGLSVGLLEHRGVLGVVGTLRGVLEVGKLGAAALVSAHHRQSAAPAVAAGNGSNLVGCSAATPPPAAAAAAGQGDGVGRGGVGGSGKSERDRHCAESRVGCNGARLARARATGNRQQHAHVEALLGGRPGDGCRADIKRHGGGSNGTAGGQGSGGGSCNVVGDRVGARQGGQSDHGDGRKGRLPVGFWD